MEAYQLLKVHFKAIKFNIVHIQGRQAETAVVFRSSGGKSCWPKIRVPLTKIKEDDMACADDLARMYKTGQEAQFCSFCLVFTSLGLSKVIEGLVNPVRLRTL